MCLEQVISLKNASQTARVQLEFRAPFQETFVGTVTVHFPKRVSTVGVV